METDRWQTLSSVADVIAVFPDRVQSLLGSLDLDRAELAVVRQAVETGDVVAACEALLGYYRGADTAAWLRDPGDSPPDAHHRRVAVDAVNDVFEAYGDRGQVPRDAAGRLDWTCLGPKKDLQYAIALNRHHPFEHLVALWHHTRDDAYAHAVDRLVKDWVIQHGQAPESPEPTEVWTPLNPGIRMSRPWLRAFFGLQSAQGFSSAARLLLLSTLPEHARFLIKHLRPNHNFATMQMNGLGAIGLALPEFKEAEAWRDFAFKQMLRELESQVYPDGAQKELSFGYHWVALANFEQLARAAEAARCPPPPAYSQAVERMFDYLAGCLRPTGCGPLCGDSDLKPLDSQLLEAAIRCGRCDWRYIATRGREGQKPAGPASRFFPWAGQLISRSGWAADAHWSYFDAGPYGISHQHNDALHLSISPFGRDVLVDSGRFAYQGEIAERFRRPYAVHSRGHNVVLLDGMGQQASEPEASRPHDAYRVTEDLCYAFGRFDSGFAHQPVDAMKAWNGFQADRLEVDLPATHQRAVLFLPRQGWVVFDRIEVEGEHEMTPLWHFHPQCTVAVEGQSVLSTDAGAGNLRITPAGPIEWRVTLVRGQDEPHPQGWFSQTYSQFEPATCAVYKASVREQASFAWVITPDRDRPAAVQTRWLQAPGQCAQLEVTWPDGSRHLITAEMAGKPVVAVQSQA